MKRQSIVIFTGHQCTGKTSMAESFSKLFALPLISRDMIKENLFDSLGCGDREHSKQLGHAAYSILKSILSELMKFGRPIVVESNFCPIKDSPFFNQLIEHNNANIVQVVLTCSDSVLLKRFKERAIALSRHRGHLDRDRIDEFRELLEDSDDMTMKLTSKNTLNVDTSEFKKLDVNSLFKEINEMIHCSY